MSDKQKLRGGGVLLIVIVAVFACASLVNHGSSATGAYADNPELLQVVKARLAADQLQDLGAREEARSVNGLRLFFACQDVLASPGTNSRNDVRYCMSLQHPPPTRAEREALGVGNRCALCAAAHARGA